MKTKDTPKKRQSGEYTFRGWIIRKATGYSSTEWECGLASDEDATSMVWDATFDTKADCVAHVREKTEVIR